MNKLLARLLIVGLALLALVPTAFAQTTTESAAANPLAGTSWTLTAIDGQPVIAGSTATLQFAADALSGSGGCNRFNGPYTVDGSGLTVEPLALTRMACVDDPVTRQESAYIGLLQAALSYRQGEDTLTLVANNGKTLTFEAAPSASLAGTQWLLVSYGPADQQTNVVNGSAVTLTLNDKGQALGNGGCNHYSAATLFDGINLTVSNVISTKMACADDAVTQQESAYFAALGQVTASTLSGSTLTLSTRDGQQLVFTAASLAGSAWQLAYYGQEYAPTAVIPNSGVTLIFQNGTQIAGHGGCNSFGGEYQVNGNQITISHVISTMMACLANDITTQEQAYFAALQSVSTFKIDGNTLTMPYAEGQLTFTRLPSPDATPEATSEATPATLNS